MCHFQFWFPQCVCPEVGLLGPMAALFLFLIRLHPVSPHQQPDRGVTALISSLGAWGPGGEGGFLKATQLERGRAERAPGSASSPIWAGSSHSVSGAAASHTFWPQCPEPCRSSKCLALGLRVQDYFHRWCSWQPPKEVWKPHFSNSGNWSSGKGGDWPKTHKDRNPAFGSPGRTFLSDHIEASWWGRRVRALEYPVYSLTSAVWVGYNAWCTGPRSTRNTWSRKHRRLPT